DHRAVGNETVALPRRASALGLDQVSGARTAHHEGRSDPRRAWQRYRDHLSGADDLAEPAAHDREANPGNIDAASRAYRPGRAGADRRTARPGGHSRSSRTAPQLSASALGRATPARDDRDGARQRAGPAD